MLAALTRIAMQYSPRNAIMYVSMVDAGTIERLREMGKEIVSSADLVSQFEAVLTDAQIAPTTPRRRSSTASSPKAGSNGNARAQGIGTDEFAMVNWLSEAMRREGLVWEHGPNVSPAAPTPPTRTTSPAAKTPAPSAPATSSSSTSGPSSTSPAPSTTTSPGPAWSTASPPTRTTIFATVRDARDAAIATCNPRSRHAAPIAGWQADDAARAVIRAAGYGDWFTHRTGHNIGSEIHGTGANLDNLETHDVRLILPNTCFSVEPGIYFPGEFGVRSEINMITRPGQAESPGACRPSWCGSSSTILAARWLV